MMEKMDIYTDLPALLPGDDAEGFGVDGAGAANGLFD